MEQHIRQHGPLSSVALGMLFTGSFINLNSTQETFSPTWCQLNSSTIPTLPVHFEQTVLVLSVLIPVLPLIFNKMNDANIDMFKSHVVGQSSSFGLSEILRHYAVLPEPLFLQKCNISNQECVHKLLQANLTFLSPNKNTSFCNRNVSTENNKELFDSIHNFPHPASALLGSSLATVIFVLFFQISLFQDMDAWKKTCIILSQCVIILIVILYCFYLHLKMDSVQIFGVCLGAFVQFCITFGVVK